MLEEAAAGLQNSSLRDFTAELAEKACQAALRHHAGARWLELQLELWRELSQVVEAAGSATAAFAPASLVSTPGRTTRQNHEGSDEHAGPNGRNGWPKS